MQCRTRPYDKVVMENKINAVFCWKQFRSGTTLKNKQSQKQRGSFLLFYFEALETTYSLLTNKKQYVQFLGQIHVLV